MYYVSKMDFTQSLTRVLLQTGLGAFLSGAYVVSATHGRIHFVPFLRLRLNSPAALPSVQHRYKEAIHEEAEEESTCGARLPEELSPVSPALYSDATQAADRAVWRPYSLLPENKLQRPFMLKGMAEPC